MKTRALVPKRTRVILAADSDGGRPVPRRSSFLITLRRHPPDFDANTQPREVLPELVLGAVFKIVGPSVKQTVGGFDSHALPPFPVLACHAGAASRCTGLATGPTTLVDGAPIPLDRLKTATVAARLINNPSHVRLTGHFGTFRVRW